MINAVCGVNSIFGAGEISDCRVSPFEEGRLGGLTSEEAEGMGKGGLITAVLAGSSELGSAIALGKSSRGVAPTLTDAGGELRRILGLLTARICCLALAVRASDSLGFAAALAFFSDGLGSAAFGSEVGKWV